MNILSPDDEHNASLLRQVHPGDWTNPRPQGRYNMVVVGAGTAGLVTAAGAAGLGAKVALVERRLMGGDCLNFGCVPSKAMVSAARRAAAMRSGGEFGVEAGEVAVDFSRVMERMRRIRAGLSRHDAAARFTSLGVDVYLGEAVFTDRQSVQVAGTELFYQKAVIATGARPDQPCIPGLEGVSYFTNETIFSLTERPGRLGVIGAGPVGCELAQCFARLGSDVWLMASERGILPREDRDAADLVQRSLEQDGVQVIAAGRDLRLCSGDGGTVHWQVGSDGSAPHGKVDALLIATGRVPNTEGMNLEAAGVAVDGDGVKVDDFLRTTNKRIFACGDVCSRTRFTHSADFQARLVIQNALFLGRKRSSSLLVPRATYTSPEVAHVGLSKAQAEEQGIKTSTFTQWLRDVDRAVLDGEGDGFVRVHVRQGTDQIAGATIVAERAGDLISEITLAMVNRLGLRTIATTMHPYPTHADAIRKVADQYNRSRLTPARRSILSRWLAWRRR